MYPLWLIIGFWFVLVALYLFIAGITYKVALTVLQNECYACQNMRSCYADHGIGPFFICIVWPLGIPLVAGIRLAGRVANTMSKGSDA